MKKFSNISGVKVGEEPKIEIKVNESDEFKYKVLTLMERLLTIRTYGPVDRYLRAGLIKISGQEMFVEALVDLMEDKSLQEETKILESLKSEVKDWELLDAKIEEVNKKIEEGKTNSKLSSHKNKIKSLFNTYGEDQELFMKMIDESCERITKSDVADMRSIAAEYMSNENKYPKELFMKVSEKFKERSENIK